MSFTGVCLCVATSLLLSGCDDEGSEQVIGSGETLFIMDSGEEMLPWQQLCAAKVI